MAWYNSLIGIMGGTLFWVCLFIFICIILGVVAYFIYASRVYNKKIKVFAYMGANKYPQLISEDVARTVKKGKMGEQKLWLKRNKVFRTAYGRMMGTNEYWFVINPKDGMWVNFVMGDLDAKLGVLDIEPTDPNVRTFYVNNSSMINNKFDPQSFLDKWAPTIVLFVFALMLFIGGYFLLGRIGEITASQNSVMPIVERVAEKLDVVATKLDLLTSNSGVRPAI